MELISSRGPSLNSSRQFSPEWVVNIAKLFGCWRKIIFRLDWEVFTWKQTWRITFTLNLPPRVMRNSLFCWIDIVFLKYVEIFVLADSSAPRLQLMLIFMQMKSKTKHYHRCYFTARTNQRITCELPLMKFIFMRYLKYIRKKNFAH